MKIREHVTTNGKAVFYAAMWDDFRQAALNKGWALALHGSLANDMDIMAMPWVETATEPMEMINAIRDCFDEPSRIECATYKMPNNRFVFTLSIWSGFYLDINIINVPITEPIKKDPSWQQIMDYSQEFARNRNIDPIIAGSCFKECARYLKQPEKH